MVMVLAESRARSPRMRGSTEALEALLVKVEPFPAHAGINRRRWS